MPISLSKSKYLSGLQCPKLLWYQYNRKDAIPATDDATQALFDQGHDVGDYAKKRYPDGIEVEWGKGFAYTLTRTRELLGIRRPIFEGSFSFNNAYARVDILVPVDGGMWDLVEVKSSTVVKDVNIDDVALQQFVLLGAGVKLRRVHVMFVDTEYVRSGAIDPMKLLKLEDVTERVGLKLPLVQENVTSMLATISLTDVPAVRIGPQCNSPYACPLIPVCWAGLPPDNVTELYYLGKKAFPLLETTTLIVDADADALTDKQQIQQTAVRTGQPHVSKSELAAWLSKLTYPLYCLDFETINPAVPMFDESRPYQQIPFQFSLHVVAADGAVTHHEFLWTESADPRRAVVEALRVIGPGTVLGYNASFEKRALRELAEFTGEKFLLDIEARTDDLLVPFRNFWYYHPAQHGSCSMKAVLPAMTGQSYDGLEVADGSEAQREYTAATFGTLSAEERERIYAALRVYCAQDTEAMVKVLRALFSCLDEGAR